MKLLNLKTHFMAALFLVPPSVSAFTFEWNSIKESISSQLRWRQVDECVLTTWELPKDDRPLFVANTKVLGHGLECDGENVTYTHLVRDPNIETPLHLLLMTVSHLKEIKGLVPSNDFSTGSKYIIRLNRP